MSYKKVKNISWEGDTLVIETDDGEITKYQGAYIKNVKYEYDEMDDIVQDLPVISYNDTNTLSWIRRVFDKK